MKIVIIAQLIFPATFPRAMRATELAKELARQGHDVTLYGVLGAFEYSGFEKEHHLKVKNIGRLLFSTVTGDGVPKKNWLLRGLKRVFNKLFEFPDIELMFKMPRLLAAERDADLLISVAVPYALHWGCALAKRMRPKDFPRVWIADCGDPYMGNRVVDKPPYFYFGYLEKWFCRKADCLTVPVAGAVEGYYPEFRHKIVVIPQGVRFPENRADVPVIKNEVPTFAYAGTFYAGFRDPSAFLECLTTVNLKFKCIFFVPSDQLVKPYAERLGEKLEIRRYVPREQLLAVFRQMDFLVNFENGTTVQSPSKLIDYAIVGKPILNISQDQLDVDTINEFLRGDYRGQYRIDDPDQFRIENVARKFLNCYERCREMKTVSGSCGGIKT